VTVSQQFGRTIAWLEDLYRRPHVPAATAGLRRAEFLLEQLGNPHLSFHSVHVAGTTGKGSTTTMIGSILQAAGHRTGYFRSPHLGTYRERLAVNEEMIDETSWIRCFDRVAEVSEGMERGAFGQYELGRPTVFEVLFTMAALHFQDNAVDWAAVETGMGGRLDATNTLHSDVAVVTNISLEHTRVLGSTVEEIAAEKAAIIKAGCDAVTAARDPAAQAVIAERATSQGVNLRRLDYDFFVTLQSRNPSSLELTLSDSDGTLDVSLRVAGDFQALNAACAFGAARTLQTRGVDVTDRDIERGLAEASVPGRFEILSTSPFVVLDGGHNPAAMAELGLSLRSYFPDRRIVLLFAALDDKDVAAMAGEIDDSVKTVVVTRAPGSERATDPAALARFFSGKSASILVYEDSSDALRASLLDAGPEDVLVVAGSLYLVGWVRSQLVATGAAL
jgi:dihydrofolate synthase / folylpolyglutamate synthase